MNFNSLPELLDNFKDEKKCIQFHEEMRWHGKPVCPHCKSDKPYKTSISYKCSNKECLKKFSSKVGTVFENSKMPFRTWFAAIYLCTSHKKGISSVQLAIDLGITQKSAWYMWHRIREMLKNLAPEMLGGEGVIVEADECHIGGIEANKHERRRRSATDKSLTNAGKPYIPKRLVMGVIERGGKVALKYLPVPSAKDIVNTIQQLVPEGTCVFTDENSFYKVLNKQGYHHGTVNHSNQEYVNGHAHTNTMEGFWSILKRSVLGIYHHISEKHLERYLHEFSVRYNMRNVAIPYRLEQMLSNSEGGLLYKNLTAKA